MLPKNHVIEELNDIKLQERAFKLDFDKKKLDGVIEGKEALKQAIHIALLTQRYKYEVFSHSYGTDYDGAFDGGYMMAIGKLKNAIYDALIYDDRILDVHSFEFERMGTRVYVKFVVSSIYGGIDYETEVG